MNQHTNINDSLQQPKRQVRFSEISELVVVQSSTTKGNRDIWYNNHDLNQFKRDARDDFLALKEALSTLSPILIDQEVRGLESVLSGPVFKLLLENKRIVVEEVMREQATQKELGISNPSRISKISKHYSLFSRTWSSSIAL